MRIPAVSPTLRRWWLLLLVVATLLAACEGGEALPESGSLTPSPPHLVTPSPPAVSLVEPSDAAPTPTLAPGLPSPTPAPPTLAPGEPTSTATPSATPTATLSPAENLEMAATLMAHENYPAASEHLQAALRDGTDLPAGTRLQALYDLGLAQLRGGNHTAAAESLNRYLMEVASTGGGEGTSGVSGMDLEPAGTSNSPTSDPAAAHFHLAQAFAAAGETSAALTAYQSYLEAHPDMLPYVQPLLAEMYLAQEPPDTAAAIAAYELALTAPSHRLHEVAIRQELAQLYMDGGQYAAAQAQYDAIYGLAFTDATRGQMTYLAGRAAQLAGDTATAHGRYRRGITQFPAIYESYLGLVELVNAGVAVDDFQRGLVDYYAGAYEPAVAAFNQYITANPDSYRADTHLYLAWTHEALGDLETALAEVEKYAVYGATAETPQPQEARALFERGGLLARAGRNSDALAAYNELLAGYPSDENAADAAWQIATLTEQGGDIPAAITAYQTMAENYPAAEQAPQALMQAGRLAHGQGDVTTAQALWRQLAQGYPQNDLGATAYIWLLRTTPEGSEEAELLAAEVISRTATTGYYALRARELAEGGTAFAAPEGVEYRFEFDEAAEQAEAEAWLESWLPGVRVTSTLTSSVTQSPAFVRANKLWQIGLLAEARQEYEQIRSDYAGNALVSYQLALYFRDMGLYRSSISAASSVLAHSGQTIFTAPRFIGRLLYPIHFADLVLPLAEQYGYDPLLQFALIRQESLFESFATSYVGAQGLSQVMPATGDWIAMRLNWPNYTTADLNRPYVGLTFGAYYLDQQLAAFDGHAFVALSAYNGGPGNAARWYETAGDDLDRYLETVDFSETRLYIRRIYEGYQYYRYLYGGEMERR